jgi:hypothetical protein
MFPARNFISSQPSTPLNPVISLALNPLTSPAVDGIKSNGVTKPVVPHRRATGSVFKIADKNTML